MLNIHNHNNLVISFKNLNFSSWSFFSSFCEAIAPICWQFASYVFDGAIPMKVYESQSLFLKSQKGLFRFLLQGCIGFLLGI